MPITDVHIQQLNFAPKHVFNLTTPAWPSPPRGTCMVWKFNVAQRSVHAWLNGTPLELIHLHFTSSLSKKHPLVSPLYPTGVSVTSQQFFQLHSSLFKPTRVWTTLKLSLDYTLMLCTLHSCCVITTPQWCLSYTAALSRFHSWFHRENVQNTPH